MDTLLDELKSEWARYQKLSHQEVKTRIELEKTRNRLKAKRDEIRAMEFDLMEITQN
jgi:hypothetical protein